MARVLLSSLIGAVVCAVLCAAMFALLALFDGTRPEEAFAFGIIVGFGGALIGALIGFVVGIAKLGVTGGAIAGLLATAAVVALYVLVFSRPGQIGYFLSESRVIFVVLALPAILTGIITAYLKNRLSRSSDVQNRSE